MAWKRDSLHSLVMNPGYLSFNLILKKLFLFFFPLFFFIQSLYNLIEDLLRLAQPSEQGLISAFTL